MEANATQGEQAQSAVSQRQSRQHCSFQSTPWFAHLMPPRQMMWQSLLTLPCLTPHQVGAVPFPADYPCPTSPRRSHFASHQPRPASRSWQVDQRLSQDPFAQHRGKQDTVEDPPSPLSYFTLQTHWRSLLLQWLQI